MIIIHLFNTASQFVWDIIKVIFVAIFLMTICAIVLVLAGVLVPFICAIAAKRVIFPIRQDRIM